MPARQTPQSTGSQEGLSREITSMTHIGALLMRRRVVGDSMVAPAYSLVTWEAEGPWGLSIGLGLSQDPVSNKCIRTGDIFRKYSTCLMYMKRYRQGQSQRQRQEGNCYQYILSFQTEFNTCPVSFSTPSCPVGKTLLPPAY